MWSFVGNKANKQWIWLALDAERREIVGVYVGARRRDGAQRLWDVLPSFIGSVPLLTPIFGQLTIWCFPPCKRHQSVGKQSSKTSLIERFNLSAPTCVSSSEEDMIVFPKVGEPYGGNLVLCSPLQFILTCLALPKYEPLLISYGKSVLPKSASRFAVSRESKVFP